MDMPALNQPVSLSRVLQGEQSINGRFELAVICEAGYGSHLLTRGVNGEKLKTHPTLRSKLFAKGFYARMGGERDNPPVALAALHPHTAKHQHRQTRECAQLLWLS